MRSIACILTLAHVSLVYSNMLHGTVRGWNSWDAVGLDGNETLMRQAGKFLKSSGLFDKQYTWITNDAGWYASSASFDPMEVSIDKYGRLVPSSERFPSCNGSFAPLTAELK